MPLACMPTRTKLGRPLHCEAFPRLYQGAITVSRNLDLVEDQTIGGERCGTYPMLHVSTRSWMEACKAHSIRVV